MRGSEFTPRFLTTDADTYAILKNNLIRCLLVYLLRREHANFVVTAFPLAHWPLQIPAKVELASMLPGFRFLFAAIMLSLSILVFGLGATALLRAAHEEFASNPAWHPGPETTFAQQGEAIRPVLALLRVDAAVVEKSSDDAPVAAAATPRPAAEQAAIPRAPAEPEKVAALKPEDSSQPEPAKPEIPVVESPVQEKAEVPGSERTVPDGATAARADAPASVDEMKIAAIEQARSPANEVAPAAETVPAALEPTSAAASPDTGLASTRIATLGGPPVTIGGQLSDKAAGAELESIIKKRQQARRAALRRRMAARARLARLQALQQQAANPFFQPAIQPGVQPAFQPAVRPPVQSAIR
jgi:hypothetical protein